MVLEAFGTGIITYSPARILVTVHLAICFLDFDYLVYYLHLYGHQPALFEKPVKQRSEVIKNKDPTIKCLNTEERTASVTQNTNPIGKSFVHEYSTL